MNRVTVGPKKVTQVEDDLVILMSTKDQVYTRNSSRIVTQTKLCS